MAGEVNFEGRQNRFIAAFDAPYSVFAVSTARAAIPHFFTRYLMPYPASEKGRFVRFVLILFLLSAFCETARAQEARAILQKTALAYQSLRSYSGRAAVSSQIVFKGRVLRDASFTVGLQFRRPDRLMLDIASPTGSRVIYNDGKLFTIYDVSSNTFTRHTAAPDLSHVLSMLAADANVFTYLDPLYFMAQGKIPAELSELKLKGTAVLNGHSVYLLTGVTRLAAYPLTDAGGQTRRVSAENRRWNWWIDRQNFLIWQVESRAENVKVRFSKQQGGKTAQAIVSAVSLKRHTVLERTVNPALNDGNFFFSKPETSKEPRPNAKP